MNELASFSPEGERAGFESRQTPPPGPHELLAEMGHDVGSATRVGAEYPNNRDLLDLAATARARELAAGQAYGGSGVVIERPSPVAIPQVPTQTPAEAAARYASSGSPDVPKNTLDTKL